MEGKVGVVNRRAFQARNGGFTRMDLAIVVLSVVALVSFFYFGLLPKMRQGSQQSACSSNLRAVGLAFRVWAHEQGEVLPSGAQFPFGTRNVTNPHTSIVLTSNTTTARAWMHFQEVSKEVSNVGGSHRHPRVFVCPADRSRRTNVALDFLAGPKSLCAPSKRDNAVSYFVGLSADEYKAQAILIGDRNLAPSNTLPAYSTIANGGAIIVRNTSQWSINSWHKLHSGFGNIGLADGSVHKAHDMLVRGVLTSAEKGYGTNINLFLFPQ